MADKEKEENIYKDDYHKRLRGNFASLVENMNAKELLDYLFQDGAIDDEEMEFIDSRPTTKGANRKLLSYLYKKDHRAFGAFLEALRLSQNSYIADNLLQYDVSCCKADDKFMEKELDQDKRLEVLTDQVEKQTTILLEMKGMIDNIKNAPAGTEGAGGETTDSAAAQVKEFEGILNGLNENLKDYVDAQIVQMMEEKMQVEENAWKRRSRELEARRASASSDEAPKMSGGSSYLYRRMKSYQRKGTRVDRDIEKTSVRLAKDIIRFVCFGADVTHTPDQYEKAMRRLVTEVLKKESDFFRHVMNTMKIDEINGLETVCNVAEEMLRTGNIHWGKVTVLYTFVGLVAKLCVTSSKGAGDEFLENLGDFLGFYVNSKLGLWIQENGGWDAFVTYFPEQGTESQKAWKTLVFTALGLGTTAAIILAKR